MGPYLLYLDWPTGQPDGRGGESGKQPGRRRTSQRTTKTGRKTTLAPPPGGLFCAPPSPSIINMYLFFHFNLDWGSEQSLVCAARVGRGRNSPPPGGWVGCVCMCVAYARIACDYAVPACPAWFTSSF